jgi:UDP-GlcNAc:undecaprenyl-phosphate/decaprenyl-phosphate GlcNAc-1-phosphate transferase
MFFELKYSILFLGTFFVVCVFFSFLINWLFLKLSFNLGTRNNGELQQERWAAHVKPAIGGLSFFIVFLISISIIGILPRENQLFLDKHLMGIMAASSLGFILGLADDAYNTNPLVKFIGQLSCAFILILSDVYIKAIGIPAIDFAITVIWVIGLMNSINMLDNMDAITTSISISIILGLITVVFAKNLYVNNFNLVMMVGVMGALTGFLYFNWHPSKIFMGDTGSQFLGVFLAACGIEYFWQFKDNTGDVIELKQFVVPMLMFIVPLIDTTTVTVRRLMRKQSPFVGGKDHITHMLFYFGLKERKVALTLITISLTSIPLCYLILTNIIVWNIWVTFAAFAYFATVFVILQIIYNIGAKRKDVIMAAKAAAAKAA